MSVRIGDPPPEPNHKRVHRVASIQAVFDYYEQKYTDMRDALREARAGLTDEEHVLVEEILKEARS